MTDNVIDFNLPEPPSVLGPERGGRIVIHDGRRIPLLHGYECGDDITIVVDGRFAATFNKQTVGNVVFLLAEAIAVSSGYSDSGASTKGRPFAPQVCELGGVK